MKLAAIGLGGLGHYELEVYDEIDGVEIIAGADVAAPSREDFEAAFDAPAYEDYERLLDDHGEDLDAVSIVTPHTLHYEQAMAAFERGLHVFLEKPMVTSVDNAVDLVETAAKRDLVLAVGYQRHFHPAYRELRNVVQSGRIGDVHMINCYLGQEWIDVQKDAWRADPTLSGGGQLYDSGAHLLDALLWTTGTRPRSVAATMDYREHDVDVNSALAATLERDGNVVTASIGVSADGTTATPHESLTVIGTDGHATYRDGELTVVESESVTYEASFEHEDFEALTRAKLDDFVTAVETGADPAVPGEVGLQVTALTEAAYNAYESGRSVDVTELVESARSADVPAATSD